MQYSLPIFAFTAALAFVVVLVFAPQTPAAYADPIAVGGAAAHPAPQSMTVIGPVSQPGARDNYTVTRKIIPVAPPVAPAKGKLGPAVPASEAQQIAYEMVQARGWGDDEFSCLVALWNKESGWNVYAHNTSSGAYGIPQALPGEKMASAGADWATNPATQITWGLSYISGRYGTPCGAWETSEAQGWY